MDMNISIDRTKNTIANDKTKIEEDKAHEKAMMNHEDKKRLMAKKNYGHESELNSRRIEEKHREYIKERNPGKKIVGFFVTSNLGKCSRKMKRST